MRIAVEFTQGEYLHPESLDEFADERAAVHGAPSAVFIPFAAFFREINQRESSRGADRTLDDVRE